MDRTMLWRKLAERWWDAAATTPHPGLRRCYAERAIRYADLAVAEGRRKITQKPPSPPAARNPGAG